MAHGALSQLARDYSASLAQEGIVVSVVDLLLALVRDLSDRIFDGHDASGGVVYVGQNHRITLNSYTMRKHLSEAVVLYSKHLQSLGKLSNDDIYALERPDNLIDSVSKETQPELFPNEEKPKSIDKNPPHVKVFFAKENLNEQRLFPFLNGDVFFNIDARDDTKIQEIKLIEPKLTAANIVNSFGPILVSQLPQSMLAAKACGKKDELSIELKKREISEQNVICACFEVSDVFNNTTFGMSCFQRAMPELIINSPQDKAKLSSHDFAEGVKIQASVSSGLPLNNCKWQINRGLDGVVTDGVLPAGDGIIDGTKCIIEEELDGDKLFDGTYYLVIDAKDIAGRVNSKRVRYFEVRKELPVVEITSPSSNEYIAKPYIEIRGKVLFPEAIDSIEYEVHGPNPLNEGNDFFGRAVIDIAQGTWSAVIGQKLAAGQYSFNLLIKDIYGNQKVGENRLVTIDLSPPMLLGALDGVPQNPYLQETREYIQRRSEESEKLFYIVEPVSESIPINWQNIPKIHRWLTRIADIRSAPSYTVKIVDNNMLKEVRYSFDNECSDLIEKSKVVNGDKNLFTISLYQGSANFDLTYESDRNGYNKPYCLSIWAIDQAGNISSHKVEFIWKLVMPPVSLEVNAQRYFSYRRPDDVIFLNRNISSLFNHTNPIELKRDVVIAHVIITNPFAEKISTKLDLNNDMNFKIFDYGRNPNGLPSRDRNSILDVKVPIKSIDIRYFEFDSSKKVEDMVGKERVKSEDMITINAGETLVAKFILSKDLRLDGLYTSNPNFWHSIGLELGFTKIGQNNPLVDGLSLTTRDANLGQISATFLVPWGDNHDIRRRTPAITSELNLN